MTALLLWLLATLDSSMAAYREAAGRNALINKQRYFARAMIKGAVLGQVAVALVGLAILGLMALSHRPELLVLDLERAGHGMLVVYVPYAVVTLLAVLIRTIPSVDLRSITSTVIFGPFTLIRPLVAAAGVISGIAAAPRIIVAILGAAVLIMMLSIETALGWFRTKGIS